MALRYHRRMKDFSKFLSPLVPAGNRCQQYGKTLDLLALPIMRILSAPKPIANWTQARGFCEHMISAVADVSHEPANEIDLLSFIKASLDEFEGTNHYWLNRSDKNDQLFGADGVFLVLAAKIFDSGIVFEKLKTIQKRYTKNISSSPPRFDIAIQVGIYFFIIIKYIGCRFPHITIMSLKATHSSADQMHLIHFLLTENITFPILMTQQTFPQIEKGACYILFKDFSSPVIYHEDTGLEILCKAVRELQVQPSGDSKLRNILRSTSWKQDGITKDQYIFSPAQNLLLYYPGCVSADESAKRLFFSDCNHHRIIVSDENGEILDCIGSSPGFEDGDFESAKLRRPAGSYYHDTEDCLYFVDSENHAIRKADIGARTVETLYPTTASNTGGIRIWNWIMSKLGLESSGETNVEEKSEVFDSKSLCFPWHLLKSVDDTLYIIDRRFQTLWTLDFSSGKIGEVFEGLPRILETCGQPIMKNLCILDQIQCDWLQQQQISNGFLVEGLPRSDLLSSLVTLHDHVFICDPVGQRILKVNGVSGICSDFQLSNLKILGLPYWLNFPLESFYAVANGLSGIPIDHLQHFDLLPGRIDIRLSVDVPMDIELVEPLQESCIWCQARGATTEISGVEDTPGSLDKVGVAQQWYDELDYLAAPKPESEINVKDDILDKHSVGEDVNGRISCGVCSSPGTSEVIIYAVLYCKLRRVPNSNEGNREEHAARILDILSSKRSGKLVRDLWNAFLLQSKGDLRDLIFTKPLHVRVRLNCSDHPKADNGRDIILTDSSIKVGVSLN
ncbi:LOW QUALITY PROTEIN: uncharacterized protein LOC113868757 [Abrus precatorius]|uniref:LOW QUALITY PROTEIN: uncharacterized protein LOC113868757 n=1 Tax=Abrus precatorius TaxID=3816 RepID=A0A8B8LVX7_ABRPR|nr:LOW QUALITY PROTEIN: uncharacterized protein LOC113868757 [Abrus precatorius]